MTLKPFGLALCAVSLATPMIWFPEIAKGRDAIALFSQYLGIWALIVMALAQIIATRLRLVESLFGGLDRSYKLHKWLGIGAMVAILLHDTIDAEMRGLGAETLLVEVAETAGELSLYGLLILVIITIATFIPYHLWRWTHKLMGFFFVAGAFHYLFILKPFANNDPLGIYTAAFCVVGILAFLYRYLPPSLRPSHAYEISQIAPAGAALSISLTPQGRGLRHRAGQFAFISFNGGEPHPFTISQAPQDDRALRVSVAPLGDDTHRFAQRLKPGTRAQIEGPFGRFERPHRAPRELWIAGGIGITPFLAWAGAKQDATPVDLIYCVREASQAAHLEELRQLAETAPNLTLHIHESAQSGRLTAESALQLAGADVSDLTVSFCGPAAMRQSLAQDFGRLGLSGTKFRYELFEIRTGLGLRALSGWVQKRIS